MNEPNGLITLSSDFGLEDPFVGIMKGVILGICPTARLVDLSHQTPPFRPVLTGFWLTRAVPWFPAGTLHLAVVDPGVGTERGVLAVGSAGQHFVAPDNGLLGPVIDSAPPDYVIRVETAAVARLTGAPASATFHGRDLFAPLAAWIASGEVTARDLGEPAADYVPGWLPRPQRTANGLRGEVLLADHFGNLITNINAGALHGSENWQVTVDGHRPRKVHTYGNARAGELVWLINAQQLLEIAVSRGSARDWLQLESGAPVTVDEAG